jgi:small-conductance mechanosensitive channel
MESWSGWLEQGIGLSSQTQLNIVLSLAGLVLLWLARAWLFFLINRQTQDPKNRYTRQRLVTTVSYVLAVLLLSELWLRNLADLATYFGLLSAGLAIALKDPLTDFFGWLFILWRRPFVVGDRIQIGDTAGDVIDLRIFQFSLLEIGNWVHSEQSTGRIIHIPNSRAFTRQVANYTRGFEFLWNEIAVTVTFESDWEKAKGILEKIVNEHASTWSEEATRGFQQAARDFLIFSPTTSPIVYTDVIDIGVNLILRYLCPVRQRRDSTHVLWEAILKAFKDEIEIDFAYPTQRFYDARLEGKEALQGSTKET